MKKLIKKMIRKIFGWYIEPLYSEGRLLKDQLRCLEDKCEQLSTGRDESRRHICDIESREEWTREQLDTQGQRIADIERREEWTRGRFDAQEKRISDIEDREEWTRERFSAQEQRIADIEGREEWTRDRFQEIASYNEQLKATIEDLMGKIAVLEEKSEHLQKTTSELCPTFAQSGEDAITAYILQFLQIPIEKISYLDLGANHAKELSNTYAFYRRGACGVLVEANPELIPELVQERPADIVLNRAVVFDTQDYIDFYVINGDGLSTTQLEDARKVCETNPELHITGKYRVKTIQMEQLLSTYFDDPPTILSIDLEGIEEEILKQIDYEKYSPWIIILENISYTPLLSAGKREFHCVEFLKQHGYVEYAFTGINSIFVLKKAVEDFNKKRQKELENR